MVGPVSVDLAKMHACSNNVCVVFVCNLCSSPLLVDVARCCLCTSHMLCTYLAVRHNPLTLVIRALSYVHSIVSYIMHM